MNKQSLMATRRSVMLLRERMQYAAMDYQELEGKLMSYAQKEAVRNIDYHLTQAAQNIEAMLDTLDGNATA